MLSTKSEHVHSHGGSTTDACGHAHDHEHAHDPTLASCCERDERQYARAMALKRLLTAHDPTSGGVRLRQQLFAPPSSSQVQISSQTSQMMTRHDDAHQLDKHSNASIDSGDDDDDDDLLDDDDDGLGQLFAARRQALEAQVRLAAQIAADGFGVVAESDAAQLLQELRTSPEVPRVVLVTSGETSAALQKLLNEMVGVARKFVGTKFARVTVRGSGDPAARELRLRSAPCVAAFRNGEQVDSTPLDSSAGTDPAMLWEARLVPWLNMCGVMATTRHQSNKSTSSTTGAATQRTTTTDADDDVDTDTSSYDCGVENCRIRFSFEHEHVGPSQESKGEISAWRR